MFDTRGKKISAIVPAYNEAPRIGRVLELLSACPYFFEVVVVDDGSTDDTEKVVLGFHGVRYIRHAHNLGKGAAMEHAVQQANGEILFFCDADVNGLTHRMITELLKPVVQGVVPLSIAVRDRRLSFLRYAVFFFPLLGGERAVTRELWNVIPGSYKTNFKIEVALNFYARRQYGGLVCMLCDGLFHTVKEKKFGFINGLKKRARMILDIASAIWSLWVVRFWSEPRPRIQNKTVLYRK